MPLIQEKIYTEEDYYSFPDDVRVELINGKIYDQAAPSRMHQEILNFLNTEINIYVRSQGGSCKIYPAPFAVKLFKDRKTIVEPDISVICDEEKLTDQGCSGAPDWIIEIVSPSNSGHDYIRKLNLYADAGVREYWIVNPLTELVYVYFFAESNLKAVAYSFGDKIKGNIFENLQICLKEFMAE